MTPALVPMTVVVSPLAVDHRSREGYMTAAKSVPHVTTTGERGLVTQNQSTWSAIGKNSIMMNIVNRIPTITSKTECIPATRNGIPLERCVRNIGLFSFTNTAVRNNVETK